MTENHSPSDVVAARIKALRRQRQWSLADLARRCAQAGADQLTENSIENIEHGRRDKNRRRRRMVTVDELLVLALVLEVAPVHLLVPLEDETPYQVAPDRTESAGAARDWIRGFWYLEGTDPRAFLSEVPKQEFLGTERYLQEQQRSLKLAANARQGARKLREYAQTLRQDGDERGEQLAEWAERQAQETESNAEIAEQQAQGRESFMWARRSARKLSGD